MRNWSVPFQGHNIKMSLLVLKILHTSCLNFWNNTLLFICLKLFFFTFFFSSFFFTAKWSKEYGRWRKKIKDQELLDIFLIYSAYLKYCLLSMTMILLLYLTIVISDNLRQNQFTLDFSFTDWNIKLSEHIWNKIC